jgi:hypothetical protein
VWWGRTAAWMRPERGIRPWWLAALDSNCHSRVRRRAIRAWPTQVAGCDHKGPDRPVTAWDTGRNRDVDTAASDGQAVSGRRGRGDRRPTGPRKRKWIWSQVLAFAHKGHGGSGIGRSAGDLQLPRATCGEIAVAGSAGKRDVRKNRVHRIDAAGGAESVGDGDRELICLRRGNTDWRRERSGQRCPVETHASRQRAPRNRKCVGRDSAREIGIGAANCDAARFDRARRRAAAGGRQNRGDVDRSRHPRGLTPRVKRPQTA